MEEKQYKLEFVDKELEILDFWEKNNIFQKTIEKNKNNPEFIFYEGPPTANGMPGVHHVLSRVYKDLICRYKTQRGFLVSRKSGWDTHGLPVELEVEKELNLNSKKEIENYGIDKFNQKARTSVWKNLDAFTENSKRIGYWIDLSDPYITYKNEYIETEWWILKQIFNKGLIEKGHKVIPYCPRCGTGLSSHELSQGYKTVKDPSIYVKAKLIDSSKFDLDNVSLLVWTTTPWTLFANTAIAVNELFDYTIFKLNDEYIISHIDLNELSFIDSAEKITTIKGKDLIGLKYTPFYNYTSAENKIYDVVKADFVCEGEGTGLVHIAPAFGLDDMELGKKENLEVIKTVNEQGKMMDTENMLDSVKDMFFKDADPIIMEDLKQRNILLHGEPKGAEHEYPFCWRCDSPLIYIAQESWFIKTTQIKNELIKNNQEINWVPKYIKDGRFGSWLEDVKDWALSRERYWGTPLPIWICECGHLHTIGSIEELKEMGQGLNDTDLPINPETKELDLHRPYIDNFKIKCPKCNKAMQRTPEVIDCWFDSGSMPFAQAHFPFSFGSKDEIKDISEYTSKGFKFPADFICEGIDQTRGWFYTLLAISTLLGFKSSYKNVISLGLVLDENGQKMSKSKGNIIRPNDILDPYGADTLRWYFFSMNSPAESKKFSITDLVSSQRRFLNTIWNVLKFYTTYADKTSIDKQELISNFSNLDDLNKWILVILEKAKQDVCDNLDKYNTFEATKVLDKFVDDMSRWYLRRSRTKFQKPTSQESLKIDSQVLGFVLNEFSILLAPFCPFISEMIFKETSKNESVHLEVITPYNLGDDNLLSKMDILRNIATEALNIRQELNFKVRQPLQSLILKQDNNFSEDLINLIKEEINVKDVVINQDASTDISYDTNLSQELINEGKIREITRLINGARQKSNCTPDDFINISFIDISDSLKEFIQQNTDEIKETSKVSQIVFESISSDYETKGKIDDDKFTLQLKKEN